jgi:hypothetical protein
MGAAAPLPAEQTPAKPGSTRQPKVSSYLQQHKATARSPDKDQGKKESLNFSFQAMLSSRLPAGNISPTSAISRPLAA